MAGSRRAALTGVAVAGLVALAAGTARAQDIIVMTSVPGLNFPFLVHMLKAMQDEGDGSGNCRTRSRIDERRFRRGPDIAAIDREKQLMPAVLMVPGTIDACRPDRGPRGPAAASAFDAPR